MIRTFLLELDARPDGVVNQQLNSYSSLATTTSMFFQRCAVATTSTQFTHVFLQVIDDEGVVYESRLINTLYEPPEPEPEEPEEDNGGV